MTPSDRARLVELCERATPGPWFTGYAAVHSEPLFREYNRIEKTIPEDAPDEAYEALPDTDVCHVPVVGGDTPTAQGAKDAAFIAAARSAVPELLAENERLRALAIEAVEIAVMSMNHLDRNAEAKADRLSAISKDLSNV